MYRNNCQRCVGPYLAVAVAVTVTVVIVVTVAAVPLTPVNAVLEKPVCHRRAALFRVDLAHTGVIDMLGELCAAIFTGRRLMLRLGLAAKLVDAELPELPRFDSTGLFVAGQLDAFFELFCYPRLTFVLTGCRLALPAAFVEAVNRPAEASLAVLALRSALIENRKCRGRGAVATFAVRDALSIGSRVENGFELRIAARGVGPAALHEHNGSHEKRE